MNNIQKIEKVYEFSEELIESFQDLNLKHLKLEMFVSNIKIDFPIQYSDKTGIYLFCNSEDFIKHIFIKFEKENTLVCERSLSVREKVEYIYTTIEKFKNSSDNIKTSDINLICSTIKLEFPFNYLNEEGLYFFSDVENFQEYIVKKFKLNNSVDQDKQDESESDYEDSDYYESDYYESDYYDDDEDK